MSMTCEEFLAAQLKASNANLLGIVTCEQKAVSHFKDRKKVFAQEELLGYVCKLQAKKVWLQTCGYRCQLTMFAHVGSARVEGQNACIAAI